VNAAQGERVTLCISEPSASSGHDPLRRAAPPLLSRSRCTARPSTISRRFSVAAGFYRTCVIDAVLEQISGLLHEAGETHHRVFRIVDGADDDWASWYAQWLIDLSELPDLLGARPVRSELIYLLVSLDKQFTAEAPGEAWEIYHARQILHHFQPSAG
jgi:hypothetical protein